MAIPTAVSVPRLRARKLLRFLIGLIVLALVALAGFAAWFLVAGRGALPQVDGTLKIGGLTAPVYVVRDPQGVPTISAASLEDLFFAQGFVTAQDRLWQMDMLRRYASGRLAEVLGPGAVNVDIRQRTLLMPMVAAQAAAALSPRDRSYMEAYARGVNAYIDSQRNHLPIEFRVLNYEPQPWTVVDSMLVGASMSEMLNLGELKSVLNREKIIARVGPELASDLYPNSSFRDHPPVPSSSDDESSIDASTDEITEAAPAQRNRESAPQHRRVRPHKTVRGSQRVLRHARHSLRVCVDPRPAVPLLDRQTLVPGSNNWVISGAHTASGKPLLSNDMHLPHQMPNLWYEVHLTSGNFDVSGVSLPGVPFVIVGHNQRIAWGFTNIGPSVTDLYVEDFNQQGQYLTPEGWKEPEHRYETIRVRWGHDRKLDVVITRHGPIVSGLVGGEKRTLALKWVAYDPAGLQEPFFDVDSAQNWDEFRQAFSRFGGPGQNVVYADVDGHIGYQATGLVPIRPASFHVVTADPNAAEEAGADSPERTTAHLSHPGSSSTLTAGASSLRSKGEDATSTSTSAAVLDQDDSLLTGTPVPGSDNSREWLGYIPFDKLPSVLDPTSGIIATANGRITPVGYPYMISNEWGPAYRTERIYRVLSGDKKFTPADMLALQTDIYSDFDRFCAQRFAYATDHAARSSQRARQAADILRTWDGRMTTNSAAPSIVAAARHELSLMLLEPKLGPLTDDYRWSMSSVWLENVLLLQPTRWLPAGFASYDDLLAAAMEKSLKDAPRNLSAWDWGKQSFVSINHPLFGDIPVLRRFAGPGKHEQSGNGFTVKQVGLHFGPSERLTVDFANFDDSTLNTVTGQSGNLFSPYYMDQWAAWYNGTTFALPFSSAAVQQTARHRLTLQPKR
jgi:penicillin amidase